VPEYIGNTGVGAMAWAKRTVSLARPRSHAGTVLPAPAINRVLSKNQEGKEVSARVSEQLPAIALAGKSPESIPRINANEIADRVYRLMQRDLLIERDRTTRLGV
jgi:hypothetical protein